MKDRQTLKTLQQILDAVEDVARPYRTDKRVSKAMHTLYQSVANVGSEVIDAMTREQDQKQKEKEEHERKRNADES